MAAAIKRMTGSADSLDRARHSFGRRDHHHQIHRADIDPHFQAGRTNYRAQLSVLQPIFHFEPHTPVERRVMNLDLVRKIGQQFL
jgi:hypothetical protein